MAKRNGDTVQDRIVALIHERKLATGAPMPTEPQLMDLLGASRNSVREAVRALQALGIVEIRHGFGTFVGRASLDVLSPSLEFRVRSNPLSALHDLVEVRELLETGLIGRVAADATSTKLAALDALVTAMANDLQADRAFHTLLYESLGNELVLQLIDLFWQVYHQVEPILGDWPQVHKSEIVANHRRIVEALRSKDAHAAREAMSRHFTEVKTRIAKAESAS
ncbi:FadR/GntR family transcriptional regulator [Hamadaea tsunoensis]|uniref:FadR/GntR family transcriptional regulator n=1 Tax=Hamadaea tsunoensis TaxID=53368 RepID=UPI000405A890|nr:FadR/GntR family transcriptional regulator [Hamadaea tsunoensis]